MRASSVSNRTEILYIATSNPGKLRDFATAAAASSGAEILILPLPGLSEIPAPDEDQPTFTGNATLKARFYSHHAAGRIVLADDSGLEVDALDGAPGVRSARYADDLGYLHDPVVQESTENRNNLCLLRALTGVPDERRTARYRCVLAAARDGEVLHTTDGTVEGLILGAPQGSDGFGYDPLFYLPDHHRTMAELDPVTRLGLSHRGRALAALLPLLSVS